VEDENVSWETQRARIKEALEKNTPKIGEEPECKECCRKAVERYRNQVAQKSAKIERMKFIMLCGIMGLALPFALMFRPADTGWRAIDVVFVLLAVLCWCVVLSDVYKRLMKRVTKA
jgi:Flp pilus assembly protein TadB